MEWITVILMGIGLAMDAMAVSVSNGMCYGQLDRKKALVTGLYFGGFQFIMPLLGWLLGQSIRVYITAIDHWVAFALLAYIGGAMIVGAVKPKTQSDSCPPTLTHGRLLLQALATSIDALAVGISLAFVDISIFVSAGIIGVIAFSFSVAGTLLGKRLGKLFQKRAEIVGGLVLIAIGLKILIEHLIQDSVL